MYTAECVEVSGHSICRTKFICVPTALLSANMRSCDLVDLSFERLTTCFSVIEQPMSVFSIIYERMVLRSKSFILSAAA